MVLHSHEIVLLCATEGEAGTLLSHFKEAEPIALRGKTGVSGRFGNALCHLAFTGIGMVNAAQTLTVLLERFRPDLALQFGIAGAYVPARLPVGSLAVATEEIYGELGVLTPDGWQPADLIGIPVHAGNPPRFNRFPLDRELVERAVRLCGGTSGPFVTVSQCSGVQSVGDALHGRFGAICESMEGAAAAHVCAIYDVPFLEVRGVSNAVEDRDRSKWDIPGAVRASQDAVIALLSGCDALLEGNRTEGIATE